MPSPIGNKPASPKTAPAAKSAEKGGYEYYQKTKEAYNSFCNSAFSKAANPVCSNHTGSAGVASQSSKLLSASMLFFLLATPPQDSKALKPNTLDYAAASQFMTAPISESSSSSSQNGMPSDVPMGPVYLTLLQSKYENAKHAEMSQANKLQSAALTYVGTVTLDWLAAKLLKAPAKKEDSATRGFFLNVNPGVGASNLSPGVTERRFDLGLKINF
jgi:hypothetical protein